MSNHTLPQRAQRGGPSARLCCMQSALKLKAGDILIFAKLPSGELLLGGRARTAADKDRKAPPARAQVRGRPRRQRRARGRRHQAPAPGHAQRRRCRPPPRRADLHAAVWRPVQTAGQGVRVPRRATHS